AEDGIRDLIVTGVQTCALPIFVRRGVPFREAHGIVASLVRYALDSEKELSELERDELARFSDRLDDEYYEVLRMRSWLESKVSRSEERRVGKECGCRW